MKQVHNSTTLNRRLRASASLASLAVALASLAVPASADPTAIYFGGSTLASQTIRQLGDCHFSSGPIPGDGFMSSPSFTSSPPTPGLIPTNCVTVNVDLLYAAVGSGNGFRGYISNLPDQWYGGTVNLNTMISPPPFPSVPPPFTDSRFPALTVYPYPRVDVAFSDAPLAVPASAITTMIVPFIPTTGWNTTSTISVGSTAPVTTFNTVTMGNPIQLPAFEVGVAIGVNTTGLNINSKILDPVTLNPVVGGAIQLTQAQMCAIFSGDVVDWSSTAMINYDASTAAVPFSYANVGNGMAVTSYASTSVLIRLVYRSDGSGTSFIITNYLKSVCPQLDPTGSLGYSAIFNQPNLPSTTFQNLVDNVNAVAGHSAANWVPANGSDGVATTISNGGSGFMGYVSDDFTNPYATQVSGVPGLPTGTTVAVTVPAPFSASVQNEQQRIAGTTVPAMMTTTAPTFIPPTPGGIDTAWGDPNLTAPSPIATYGDWDVYGRVFPAGTVNGSGASAVPVGGKSVLPLTALADAYPLSGTTFMAPYSCYSNPSADPTRTADILDFLNWLYQNQSVKDPNVAAIIQNNGFHALNGTWAGVLVAEYLTPGSGNAITAFNTASGAPQVDGCAGVTGGAN